MASRQNALAENVTSLAPLGDALDGSAHPPPRRPRRVKDTDPVRMYQGWQCPHCTREFPETDQVRHLMTHVNSLEDQVAEKTRRLDEIGPDGFRTETDELGNKVIFGPAGTHAVVWLHWEDLLVDDAVQRKIDPRHPLMKPGVRLDYDKTEALSVARVYGSGDELVGYRPVEGQHRVVLGRDQDPTGWQLCKVLDLESRQDESRLARQMSHGRKPFKQMEDFWSLWREGQPNITAAVSLLERKGLVVSYSANTGVITAAQALMRIAGVRSDEEPVKTPQEGVRDLEDTLNVLAGIQAGAGDSKRYSGMLLNHVAGIIEANRDVPIDVARFAQRMGVRTAEDWLSLPALGRKSGLRHYLRDQLVLEYNKGARDPGKLIS
jgi:hypothetical protein